MRKQLVVFGSFLFLFMVSCSAPVDEPVDEESFTPDTVVVDTAESENSLPETDPAVGETDDTDLFAPEEDALPDEGEVVEDGPMLDDAVTFDEDDIFVPDSDATSTCSRCGPPLTASQNGTWRDRRSPLSAKSSPAVSISASSSFPRRSKGATPSPR